MKYYNLIPVILILNFLYYGIRAELGYIEYIPNNAVTSMAFGVILWSILYPVVKIALYKEQLRLRKPLDK